MEAPPAVRTASVASLWRPTLLSLALLAGVFAGDPARGEEPVPKVVTPPTPAGITLPKTSEQAEVGTGAAPKGNTEASPPSRSAPRPPALTRSMPLAPPEAVPLPAELPKGLRAPSRSITGEAAAGEGSPAKAVGTEGSQAASENKLPTKIGGDLGGAKPASALPAPGGKLEAAPVDLQPAPMEGKPVVGVPELKRASANEIIATSSKGRNAYRLADNPRVIILDMPDIRDQGLVFGRLVLFIERANAPKSRLMFLPEVQGWLKQNKASLESLTVGNNLRASELARFYNTARFQGEALTGDERQLYDWLLAWNLLQEGPNGVTATMPEHILISFPQASSVSGCNTCSVTQAQRETIAKHELAHAKLATDLAYQHYCEWFWSQALTPSLRERFTRFLQARGYDPNSRELLANEAQAFLMYTPDPTMFSAQLLGVTEAELQAMRNLFESGLPPRPLATSASGHRF